MWYYHIGFNSSKIRKYNLEDKMYLYHWLKSTIKNYNKIIAVYKFNFIGAETGFLSIYVLILFYLCLYWRLSKVFFTIF